MIQYQVCKVLRIANAAVDGSDRRKADSAEAITWPNGINLTTPSPRALSNEQWHHLRSPLRLRSYASERETSSRLFPPSFDETRDGTEAEDPALGHITDPMARLSSAAEPMREGRRLLSFNVQPSTRSDSARTRPPRFPAIRASMAGPGLSRVNAASSHLPLLATSSPVEYAMPGESTAPSGSLSCHSAFEPPAAMNESLSCQPPCGDALPAHVFYNHTGRVTTLLPTQYWWTAAKTDTAVPSQRVLPDPTSRSCWSSLSEIGIHLSKDLDPDQARLPFAS